ncbi:MAG: PCRF domain-containing protein [Verrucomicrobia bacterium]|nr:PCRF domain-containing protein [Verrucomicrobiota bacterium]
MDFAPLIVRKQARFDELEKLVAAGDLYDDPKRARELLREHTRLKELLSLWHQFQKVNLEWEESSKLATGTDMDLAEMAQAELPELEKTSTRLKREIQVALLPPDPNDDRDAIVEIRAGTGGDEAALFAADLARMYARYAEITGLKIEQLECSANELSTATVAVLPEAEEVDLELKADELRIEVCRAGGPGGQGVNTTDSAVQVLHIPSGMIVRCQDGRSQQKNKEKALQILRSRLLERKQREEAEKYAAQRKNQVGTGGRGEKMRTYNYPQNRVTDHRIGLTLYSLDRFLEGDLEEMLSTLQTADMENRLEEASETEHSAE